MRSFYIVPAGAVVETIKERRFIVTKPIPCHDVRGASGKQTFWLDPNRIDASHHFKFRLISGQLFIGTYTDLEPWDGQPCYVEVK